VPFSDLALLQVAREAVYLVLLLSLPPLLAGLLLSLVTAALQSVTQVHEQTLTLVPRLLAVLLTMAVAGPWIGAQLVRFTTNLLALLPAVAAG
jgi:flagellar biosynthesis protein FliQ